MAVCNMFFLGNMHPCILLRQSKSKLKEVSMIKICPVSFLVITCSHLLLNNWNNSTKLYIKFALILGYDIAQTLCHIKLAVTADLIICMY